MRITEEDHIQALKEILAEPSPCEWCPVRWALTDKGTVSCSFPLATEVACEMCRDIAGITTEKLIKFRENKPTRPACPCYVLGEEKALKGAVIIVEEWEEKQRKVLSRKF